jgi:hypothetical protein
MRHPAQIGGLTLLGALFLRLVVSAGCGGSVAPSSAALRLEPRTTRSARLSMSPDDPHLLAIWGTSARRLFAAGERGTILRFDGVSWERMHTGTDARLLALWGDPTTVFAAGERGTILRLDEVPPRALGGSRSKNHGAWTRMSLPPEGDGAALRGLWGSGADDVYAVGARADGTSLVLRFDGFGWNALDVRCVEELRAVWGSGPDDVHVAGSGGALLRFDGARWTRERSGTRGTLRALWGRGAREVFAAGHDELGVGILLRYDGRRWAEVSLRGVSSAALRSLAGARGRVFVAGWDKTLIGGDGGHWSRLASRTSGEALWSSDEGELFAAAGSTVARLR